MRSFLRDKTSLSAGFLRVSPSPRHRGRHRGNTSPAKTQTVSGIKARQRIRTAGKKVFPKGSKGTRSDLCSLTSKRSLLPASCFLKPNTYRVRSIVNLIGGADMRVKITLACTECKQRNYNTKKNKKNDPDRLEMNKYCKFCRKHTLHKETK